MADQIERIVLNAEDRTAAATRSANSNIDSVEAHAKKANAAIAGAGETAGNTMVSISDRTKRQIDNVVAQTERRLLALKSPLDRLNSERATALSRVAGDPDAIKRVTSAFNQLTEAERSHNTQAKAIADAIRNPLDAAGKAAESFVNRFGAVGLVAGAVAVGVAAAGVEVFHLVEQSGKSAEGLANLADRMGITAEEAATLDAQARIAGVGIEGLTGVSRKLSQVLVDGGPAGEAAVRRLEKMGVNVVEANGRFRNGIDILRDFSHEFASFPDHATKVKALSDVFGRGAVELLPLIQNFSETERRARGLSQQLKEDTIRRLAEMDDKLDELGISYDRLKLKLADKIVVTVEFVQKLVAPNKKTDDVLDIYGRGISSVLGVGNVFGRQYDREITPPLQVGAAGLDQEKRKQEEIISRGSVVVDQFRSRQNVASLERQLGTLTSQQNELGARIQHGLSESAARAAVQEFDAISSRVTTLKTQIKELNEIPEAIKAAHRLLLDSQAEESTSLAKLYYERQKAIEQYGKTAEARADIDAAFANKAHVEIKKLDEARKKAAADEVERVQKGADARIKAEADVFQRTVALRNQASDIQRQNQLQGLDFERDSRLRNLELFNAQTIDQQVAVEFQRFAIARDFESKAEVIREAALERDTNRQLAELNVLHETKLISENAYQQNRSAIEATAEEKLAAIRLQSDAAVNAARETAAIRSAQIVQQYNQGVFDTFKRQAEGILDQTLTKGQNVFKALASSIKASLLTAIKDALSNRIAAQLTELVTGTKVTLQNQSPGAGPLGKLAGILGLGAKPVFGATAKLDQPGHLGDLTLVGGAVPVVMVGAAATAARAAAQGGQGALGGILAGVGAGVGLGGVLGAGRAGTAVSSSIDFGQGATSLGGSVYPGVGSGATPPFLPPGTAGGGGVAGTAGQVSFLGGLKGQLAGIGNIGSKFSAAHGGFSGVGGGAALLGGGILAADGLRRGGLLGVGETTAGGALIGAKFGGPIGAVIGAGVGLVAGLVRLGFKGKDETIIEKVKQIYNGLTISKAFARDPIRRLIDQQYGGDIEVGLRSPEIRDLLNLYAKSHDQGNSFPLQNKPQSVGLQISGGQLQQTAAYDNGTAIAYGGGTAKLAGPVDRLITGTSPASPGVASTVIVQSLQLSVNGDGARKALAGEIVNNPEAVGRAALASANRSATRRQAAVVQRTPGLLTS